MSHHKAAQQGTITQTTTKRTDISAKIQQPASVESGRPLWPIHWPVSRAGGLYRWASHILPCVPPALGYRLCEHLSLLGPRLPIWEQLLANLAHVLPYAPESMLRRHARSMLTHLFKNYYDLLRSHAIPADVLDRSVDVEGIGNLLDLLARGKQVIVAMPHMGNLSLISEPMATRLKAPILVVVEQMADPVAHDVLNTLRRRKNVEMVELGRKAAQTIMRGLRDGKVIVLASDRAVADTTVEVDFFGAPAPIPAGPALLALRTGAALLTAYTYRQPDNRSTVVIDPPIAIERQGDLKADIRRTMQAVIRIFEAYIRRHPSQWLITEPVWRPA